MNETEIEKRLDAVESEQKGQHDQILILSQFIKTGVTAGAERELDELRKDVSGIRVQVNEIATKTTKWEGGQSVLLFIIGMLGTALGWVLSHLGLTK